MMCFWSIALALPLLAFGAASLAAPAKAKAFEEWLRLSGKVAASLTAAAWLWTAFECATIGIDVFDMVLLKEPTGGVFTWVLAVVLAYLTFRWMRPNLSVRALSGILMLIPAELFKTTRLLVPESGFAPVQIVVATAYAGAIAGMYGMFYPWRLEKALDIIYRSERTARALGGVLLGWGAAILIAGMTS